jgi:hypothetical protein
MRYLRRMSGTNEFEGTEVLEKLATVGAVDEFFEAIDADDLHAAKALMQRARIDQQTIAVVLEKMANADGDH